MAGVIDQGQAGVCGFVSVLNAMAQSGVLMQHYNVSLEQMQARLGPELITWLKVKSVEDRDLVKSILEFSASFGSDYDYGTVETLIREIETAFLDGTLTSGNTVLVAMPPDGLATYLKEVFRLESVAIAHYYTKANAPSELAAFRNAVVGLGGTGTKMYNDLRHWVYVDKDGFLYNWGSRCDLAKGWFTDADNVEHDLAGWGMTKIVHVIRIQ